MKLPTNDDLEEVAQGLWGAPFAALSVPDKMLAVQIAQKGVLAHVLDNLPVELSIQFAECLVEHGPKFGKLLDYIEGVTGQLEEIDKSLAPVGEWFDKSRLYEP